MQLETTRFGAIAVAEEEVLTFTQPIIGFETRRRFVLLPGPEGSGVHWLQSSEQGDLAFLVMEPTLAVPSYRAPVTAEDLAELGAESIDALRVYTLLVVERDPARTRTNLKAPILVNAAQRLAKQTILEGAEYPIQYFLAQGRGGASEAREVSNARTDA